jgi:phosphomannomutase
MNKERVSGYDIRGSEGNDLTMEHAWNVGKALADQLAGVGKVIVVYIATQKDLAHALIEGLRLQGREVIDGGDGDKELAQKHIEAMKLAGAAVVAFDDLELTSTITLYDENGKLINNENGLKEIHDLVAYGNFVPAAVKGEITALA